MNLVEKDKQNIWHPFTQMKTAADPIVIKKGKGVWLYDENDNKILDAVSSWWVNIHGHAHPYIAEKIFEQLNTLEHSIFAGFTHQPAVELSERLLGHIPWMDKLFFSDNGSTAVEVGMKMCIQYFHNKGEEKDTIIALKNGYHGDTFGAMSACGDNGFNDPFKPFLFHVKTVETPIKGREENALEQLEKIIKENKVACFIFEPLIQGSCGMIMYEPNILDKMIQLCRENNILCIADEVMTGFYRTGKMFASNYLENKPDIMCLSKGLTGGTLPMSLTLCTNEIYNAFLSDDKMKTFFHGHSFTGNPVGCAASLASLDLTEKEETRLNIQSIISWHETFKNKIKTHPTVKDIRQRGTILAIEFNVGNDTSYFNNLRDKLYHFFLERNLLLRPLGNIVYIMTPYCITQEEMQLVYNGIEEALEKFS